MRRQIVGLLVMLVLCAATLTTAAQEPTHEVIVRGDKARIVFPVEEKETWNWYLDSSIDSQLEYAWQVTVPVGTRRCEAGFSLYKRPGQNPASGSLEDLISAGQADGWLVDDDGGTNIGGNIIVTSTADSVIVTIIDAELVHRLFGRHPQTVELQTITPDDPEGTKTTVPVRYLEI